MFASCIPIYSIYIKLNQKRTSIFAKKKNKINQIIQIKNNKTITCIGDECSLNPHVQCYKCGCNVFGSLIKNESISKCNVIPKLNKISKWGGLNSIYSIKNYKQRGCM